MVVELVLTLAVVEGVEEPPPLAAVEVVCSLVGYSYDVSSNKIAVGVPIPCLPDVPWHFENEDFEAALERITHEDTL